MGDVKKARPGETGFAQFCKCLLKAVFRPALRITRHRALVYNIPLRVEVSKEELVVRSAFTCARISAIAELVGVPVQD